MADLATIAGVRATSVRAWFSAWGNWHADFTLDGEHTLTGRVEAKLRDLTLSGTVLSGGPAKGRSFYRIIGGAGGWGRTLPSKNYADDGGVKLSKIIGDAASEVGETVAGIGSTDRVGPGFTRDEGPASRVLEQYCSQAWYVDELGVTRIGKRTGTTLGVGVPRTSQVDLARKTVTLAPTSLAGLMPGVIVDGLEAVDVIHDINASGIRTEVWGASSYTTRRLEPLQMLLEQLDPFRQYRGIFEYRVVTLEGSRANLQAVRASSGMPDLRRVRVWPGVAGCEAQLELGSRVVVEFLDADPSRPVVTHFEDAEGEGFVPVVLKLAGGADFVALAALVATQLTSLKAAINGAAVSAGDGGATFKTNIMAALASWPGSVAASKVKAS
jgi:hypothetical protein